MLGAVAHTCNSNTQEVKAGRSEVQDYPQPHSKVKASLEHITPYLKTMRKGREEKGEREN